jgi:hypothetical protein
VLHQPPKNYDPFTWSNVAPAARHGMTESDAYGKALDYMQSLVRQQQAQAVSNFTPRWRRYGAGKGKPAYFPEVETLSKNASWRTKPASDSQLSMLKEMGVSGTWGGCCCWALLSAMSGARCLAVEWLQQRQ